MTYMWQFLFDIDIYEPFIQFLTPSFIHLVTHLPPDCPLAHLVLERYTFSYVK